MCLAKETTWISVEFRQKNPLQKINAMKDGEFDWSPDIQGYILGSFFIGYVVAMIPVAKLVERYGSKWYLFGSAFVAAICTFCIPAISWQSSEALIAIQVVRGFAQGILQPSLSVLSANWFPRRERGLLLTIMKSGASIGSCLGSIIAGFLCASFWRWPSSFYATASAGMVLSILIAVFIHESPKDHPKISKAELSYILSNQECKLNKRRPKVPWGKILTSIPTYAYIYSYFGQMWAFSQFTTVQSIFLGTILHYSIAENGSFSALPLLLHFVTAQSSGFISSYLTQKNIATVNFLRRFWTLMAGLGYSACLLGIYFAGCNRNLSILFGIMSMSFNGLNFSGCFIVANDMTPTFAGTFSSLALTVACMPNVIVPLLVGYLTSEMQTIEQWNKVFFVSIAIALSSGIVFAIFGSAEVQPWNFMDEESDKKNKTEGAIEKTRF